MSTLFSTYQLYSLYKGATCFIRTTKGRPIDLMLTNKKHSFMKSQSFEAGFSDHHHLIYTTLKSTYVKLPPKTIRCRKYKNFHMEEFQRELQIKRSETTHVDYQVLHSVIVNVLQKHAPLKQRLVRGNNKPHVKADLRGAIMKRTGLKKKSEQNWN